MNHFTVRSNTTAPGRSWPSPQPCSQSLCCQLQPFLLPWHSQSLYPRQYVLPLLLSPQPLALHSPPLPSTFPRTLLTTCTGSDSKQTSRNEKLTGKHGGKKKRPSINAPHLPHSRQRSLFTMAVITIHCLARRSMPLAGLFQWLLTLTAMDIVIWPLSQTTASSWYRHPFREPVPFLQPRLRLTATSRPFHLLTPHPISLHARLQ